MDATIKVGHKSTSTVTRHPVEEGADIADHTRPEPDSISVEAVVSNTPMTPEQVARFDAAGGGKYAEGVYEQLLGFKETGTLCTVTTSKRTYRSMVLSAVNLDETVKNAGAVAMSLMFEHIIVVKNKLTRTTTAKDRRAHRKGAKGKQTPKDPKKKQSALFKLSQAASESSNETLSGLGNTLLSGGKGTGSNPP